MPRAEAGSTKYIANKLKSKGLTRLRWFCQSCQKACRDANGFKCHINSEGHVRQMQLIGEDPKKHINQFSNEFKQDFLTLLKSSHGEKSVHANVFYNQYIADKNHIHMNATKWPSLTEFVKYLGREGICQVEDIEGKGLHIAWVDDSPEALRRRDAIRRKERQDKGDEERDQRLIQQQIEKAREAEHARESRKEPEQIDADVRSLHRTDGEKIKINFGEKRGSNKLPSPPESQTTEKTKDGQSPGEMGNPAQTVTPPAEESVAPAVKMSFGSVGTKAKNVFAPLKKNPLAGKKMAIKEEPKKMSEMERIMREETARKRPAPDTGAGAKRQRVV